MSQRVTFQSCNLHKDSVAVRLLNWRPLNGQQVFERVAYN